MRRARRESSTELPSFAKLIPPKRKNRLKKPLSLKEEEEYLRTRSYHCLARQLDFAVDETFEELSTSFHEALDSMLQTQNESDEQSLSGETRAEAETSNPPDSLSNNLFDSFIIADPSKQSLPCHLLPILALHAPPYLLDRQDWMRYLVQANKSKRPTCCTVWLRSNSAVNSSWQEELRRQCFVQEPDLPASLQNVDRKPITETLVEWAKHTCCFEEIVIFLEIDCDFSNPRLQDFVHWMAERRSIQGLPFNLVLLVPHGSGRRLDIWSTSQGSGILIKHIHLPSSEEFVDKFSKNIFVRKEFPIIFPASMARELDETFEEQNKSAIDLVRKLKDALAHIFSSHWSLLLAEQACSSDDQSRIRWLLMSKEGRALAPWELSSERKSLQEWVHELHSHRRLGCISMQLDSFLRKHSMTRSVPLLFISGRDYDGLNTSFHDVEKQLALEFISQQRNRLANSSSDSSIRDRFLSQNIDSLNELIILCAASKTLVDMLRSVARLHQMWSNHISVFASSKRLVAWTQIRPRSQFLRGLVQGSRITKEFNLVATVGQMYELIEDRVSISQQEWFGLFRNTIATELSQDEALTLFGYGCFHLKLCGLLNEKTRAAQQKTEVRYEKAIVIWCSSGK